MPVVALAVAWAFLDEAPGLVQVAGVANDLTRLCKKLAPLGAPSEVQIRYGAGPTGYGLCQSLEELGYECLVVAPAKTPRLARIA